MIFRLARPLLFTLDAENAHQLTIAGLRYLPRRVPVFDPILQSQLAGVDFASPVGLAAGFDKNAEVPDALLSLGFGFVEVGTVTPLPQAGNAKPRIFRLVPEHGVINRLGFNNAGQAAAHDRLARRARVGIVGVNVGANKDSADRIADYVAGVCAMADVADYLTVNISSPNTPGLRVLQDSGALTGLLDAVSAVRRPGDPPLFLKLAPDLEPAEIDAVVKAAMGHVDALIIGNTTISRPAGMVSARHIETGGLSGAPLKSLAAQKLRDFRSATGGAIPLIAAGGIDSADEAYARIRSGAALIQMYTALIYHGPSLARTIADGLVRRLKQDGFGHVADAVGVDAV
jgi:dihydroorotate dehydrogenase